MASGGGKPEFKRREYLKEEGVMNLCPTLLLSRWDPELTVGFSKVEVIGCSSSLTGE